MNSNSSIGSPSNPNTSVFSQQMGCVAVLALAEGEGSAGGQGDAATTFTADASTSPSRQASEDGWLAISSDMASGSTTAAATPCRRSPSTSLESPRSGISSISSGKLKRVAFFYLGAATVLPWDCVVLDMGAFHTRYVPTYPWVEASTEVRTLCIVVGHLLVFFLSPGLSIVAMTLGGCFAAAVACCGLAVIAPLAAAPQPGGLPPSIAAEGSVFNTCCVLVGVIGLCCSAMHAGVYGLHAVICPSLAVSWALGGAFAGPLAALIALALNGSLGSNSPSLSTRLLLGFCACWLVLSGCLLAIALRSPAAKRALLLQRQQSMQHEPQQQVAAMWLPLPPAQQQEDQSAPLLQADDEVQGLGEEKVPCAHEREGLLQSPSGSSSASRYLLFLSRSFSGGTSLGSQWHFYTAVLRQSRCSLLCCFFLSLTTFVLYPIKVQHMVPCSNTHPAFYKLLLVAAYHLGVVAGRCVSGWCCSLSFRLVPAVLMLRLTLLPLLFWFESLPQGALMHRAAVAGSPLHKQHVLLLLDFCRCLALFLYSALHGHLSLVGAVHATRAPDTLPGREAAAYLMSLSETLGLAAGTALSIALPASAKPLESWKATTAATMHNLA